MLQWLIPEFHQCRGVRHLNLMRRGQVTLQGFSLVEVFVAILVTVIFLTVSLQLFVTAAYLRVKALQFSEAYNWVQEDFEIVRSKATAFEQDALPYSSYCGAAAANNLAATFIADSSAGLGGTSVTVGTKNLNGKAFELIRTANYASTTYPEQLVALKYSLVPTTGGASILDIDAELVIYAAFRCPS